MIVDIFFVKASELRVGDIVKYHSHSQGPDLSYYNHMTVVRVDKDEVELVRPYIATFGVDKETTRTVPYMGLERIIFNPTSNMEFVMLRHD